MTLYQRFYILGCSLFTFFCFCLPWIDGESGFQLIVGEGTFFTPLVLMVTFVIIGCVLYYQSRILIYISGLVGIVRLMVLLFSNLLFVEYGLPLAIAGFFLTIAGITFFPKPE